MQEPVLIVDNGSGLLKYGLSTQEAPTVAPNCAARSRKDRTAYVGADIDECERPFDLAFRRPAERGYVLNWDLQRVVWERSLRRSSIASPPSSPAVPPLLLTEPPFAPERVRRACLSAVFEEMCAPSLVLAQAPALALRRHEATCGRPHPAAVVVDAGFSFCHALPHLVATSSPCGLPQALSHGIRRVDIGGKALTNLLKEAVSYRQWDMMEEVHLVNLIKERACFVSRDFERDMRAVDTDRSLWCRYVFPDYSPSNMTGYVLDDPKGGQPAAAASGPEEEQKQQQQQVLSLGRERFSIPEALFRPSDIGVEQAGIAEAVMQAAAACSDDLYAPLLSNIVVCGGSSMFPGFVGRLEDEVRSMTKDSVLINVTACSEDLVLEGMYGRLAVTKSMYTECGPDYLLWRFIS
eukprot:m51a1_g12339 putative actin-related protein 6 (408) ;mRNA; r:506005-507574